MHLVSSRSAGLSAVEEAVAPAKHLPVTGLLIGIVLLSLVLRVLSALAQGNLVDALPGIHDQVSYDALARRVIEGHGFSFATNHWPATRANEPTAHWSYLYTLYLSLIYLCSDSNPLAARLLQVAVVAPLHTWFVWRIGSRIFGPMIGLLAAALSATYLYFVYYAGALITESFYIVSILWTIDVALRLAARQRLCDTEGRSAWGLWIELGLAIGVATLLRQLFVLFLPFLMAWLWWASEQVDERRTTPLSSTPEVRHPDLRWRRLFAGVMLSTMVIATLILPWTMRNYHAFGQLVPLNTNSGYAFFWGNHPYYGTQFIGILPEDGPSYLDLIPRELLGLNEAELDKALLQRGIGFVKDDPVRYLLLSLSRTQEYFKFWPTADSSLLSNFVRVGSFGLALPFILYGLWLSGFSHWQSRQREQRQAILLLYLFCTFYMVIHLLVWTLIRYRLPLDSILVIFAAVGLDQLFGSRLSRLLSIRQPLMKGSESIQC